MQTATYSPEDNKLRLYPAGRLDPETYAQVRGAGFIWAPKQELFVAPMWTPAREDLLIDLCGEVGDEDTGLVDRAEARADRFENYGERRLADAESAREHVSAIADNIPLGQPILVGHHSEKHARRDAEKIQNGMRRAVRLWEESRYWKDRAKGAIRAAKYKERPDVRARRIRGLEAEQRKQEKEKAAAEKLLRFWSQPEISLEKAKVVANLIDHGGVLLPDGKDYWSAWSALEDGKITVEDLRAQRLQSLPRRIAYSERWLLHIENRLTYERAMLEESGGIIAEQVKPERGGACKCWASPRGGWSLIQKVNKISVTVLDNRGNGGRDFTRIIPFDKLASVMSTADVGRAREAGFLVAETAIGFYLVTGPAEVPPAITEAAPAASAFEALRETVKAGVQVVTAPQLFPTPADIAALMVEKLELEPGMSVLEPSAGTGNLIRALPGGIGSVTAVEVNRELCRLLHPLVPRVVCADFLSCSLDTLGRFDRVIMNPPFANGADIKHIQHAMGFLKPGGRLVALYANGPRQREAFRQSGESIDLPPDSFKAEGTGVNVALLVSSAGREDSQLLLF